VASDWTRVKWTEARQVTSLLGWSARAGDPAGESRPDRYFADLRHLGRVAEAAEFLAQALPRWEAIAWAARCVRDVARPPRGPDADALKAALLWVQDPTEERRRAAEAAAGGCAPESPARMAALAAFYSGGSVAPAEAEALPASRDAAGRFAAGAVLVAAAAAPDMDAALDACLDAGAAIARGAEANAR
jgi:hypothetical protein